MGYRNRVLDSLREMKKIVDAAYEASLRRGEEPEWDLDPEVVRHADREGPDVPRIDDAMVSVVRTASEIQIELREACPSSFAPRTVGPSVEVPIVEAFQAMGSEATPSVDSKGIDK